MGIGRKSPRKELALRVPAAEMTGAVHRGGHPPQAGATNLLEGNLHNGGKRVLRRDAQRLESPLSATKLAVSDPCAIPRKWIRFRSEERGKLVTGRNRVLFFQPQR